MNINTILELNDHAHGKLNCGKRGYYPIPTPPEKRYEASMSKEEKRQEALKMLQQKQ